MKVKNVSKIEYFAKGKRGIVYTGIYHGKKVAVKTKNPLSQAKKRIENEILFLKIANIYGIGPKLLFNTKKYLVYEFQEGVYFEKWIKGKKKKQVVSVIKKLLEQAFILDKLGIDKEEFHRPFKNVIVKGKTPVLIDFERCHYSERPKNVTQLFQFIMNIRLVKINRKIISLLKVYKEEISEKNFRKLIKSIYKSYGTSLNLGFCLSSK